MVRNVFQHSKNTHALKSRGKGTQLQRHNSHRTLDIERLMKDNFAGHKIFPFTVAK